jgi:hypothetical protein
MTLMWFETLDSVKAFMGRDYEVAHVPAEAQAVLADFGKRSAHYEVVGRREQPCDSSAAPNRSGGLEDYGTNN